MNHYPNRVRALLVLFLLAWLGGCAMGAPASSGHTQRAAAPLITPPQVSGSSRGGTTSAHAATTIGNATTPARLRIQASASPDGVRIVPVLNSRYVNWRF